MSKYLILLPAGGGIRVLVTTILLQRFTPTPGIRNVHLLSLGTGMSLQYIKRKSHGWGYNRWLKPLVNLMFDGTAGIADLQCQQYLRKRYCRPSPEFQSGVVVPMDDIKKIPCMIEFAESIVIIDTIKCLKLKFITKKIKQCNTEN
jgi:hypothetical protein